MTHVDLVPLAPGHLPSLRAMLPDCDSLPLSEYRGADRSALAALEADALSVRAANHSTAWVAVGGSRVVAAASFHRLDWDSNHFGFGCARVDALHVPSGSDAGRIARALIRRLSSECIDRGVRFLSARCAAARTDLAECLEEAGFRLRDTSVKVVADLSAAPWAPSPPSCTIRPFVNNDLAALAPIARSFVANRFHADERIPRERADALYEEMLRNATADPAVQVTVGCRDESPIAFVTHRRRSDLDALLGGRLVQLLFTVVAPDERGRGVQTSLVAQLLACLHGSVDLAEFNTQVHNMGAQRAWSRLGFRPVGAWHIWHRWL